MGLTRDKIITTGGALHFIPSGSGASGSVQTYSVSMSNAAMTGSVLAPTNGTSSFFYFRSPLNHSVKVFYQNTGSTSIEPTGSDINLFNLSQRLYGASGSVVEVVINSNFTGSQIIDQTFAALNEHSKVSRYFTFSASSEQLFINNKMRGIPQANDNLVFSYMSGSSFFSSSVLQSGSARTLERNSLLTGSATSTLELNASDRDALELTLPNSHSIFTIKEGFYSIEVGNATTGSPVSLHGGAPVDYGDVLPNNAYIKTPGGFDILLDSAGAHTDQTFRIWSSTGIATVAPGVKLLEVDNSGSLYISGSINGGTF